MSPLRASDRVASETSRDATCLRVISALAEAFLPAMPEEAQRYREQGDERMAKFFEFPGTEGHSPAIAEEVLQLCKKHLPSEKWKVLKVLLWLLSTRLGTLLLGGRHAVVSWLPPFCQSFDRLPVQRREALLLSWKRSPLMPLKQMFKALQGLHLFVLFAAHTDGHNPLWQFVDYPGGDPGRPERPSQEKLRSEAALMAGIVDLSREQQSSGAEVASILRRHGLHVHQDEGTEDCIIECDAVVVGSGAGGGTAAGVLAKAGLKVVVVEKGTYTKAADLTTLEKDAYDNLYERGGLLMATEDGGVNIVAGATVGGGTRINWSVSFRTPPHVRKEWAEVNGLPQFATQRYDRAMDAVCQRLSVGTGVRHNKANRLLWEGLEALGADVEEMPRNCRNSERCGHCPHGCASGDKQDTTATFLADAASCGAKLLTGCFAERILLGDGGTAGRRTAQGVLARPNNSETRIRVVAPIVVASGGSLHTPALFLRSGVSCRGNVGRHLHLHVGAAVAAEFPKKDKAVDPEGGRVKLWEGPQMSTYSREAAGWADTGYGPLVSMTSAHPGLIAAGLNWEGAADFRETYGKLPWVAVSCSYIRDKDSGSVTIGPDGQPRVHYWPSAYDRKSLLKGLELNVRAMAAAGADNLFTSQPAPKSRLNINRNADGTLANPEELEAYISDMHAQGVKKMELAMFSLHQMGSCRMGRSVTDSVADGEGECWEVSGLYVADASAFPTASGVNPMITAESIAYFVADGIAQRFREKDADAGKPVKIIANGRE